MKTKIAGGVLLCLMTLVMIFIIAISLATRFALPGIPAGYLVQSGSMEPSIHVGDLVLVKKAPVYSQKDVITFFDLTHRIVTHRIADVRPAAKSPYITQGDANRTPDTDAVAATQIIGKVVAVVPKVGTLVNFVHTPAGLILLVVVPGVVIIIDELIKLYFHLKQK